MNQFEQPVRLLARIFGILALACTPATAKPQGTVPSVFEGILGEQDASAELSTAEFRAALSDPKAVVFDARPFSEFAVSHVPGARSVAGKAGTTPARYVADV